MYCFRCILKDKKGRVSDDDDEEDEWAFEDSDEEDDDDEEEPEGVDPLSKKRFRLTRRKATKATDEEIAANSRSRSARLRCLERIG